MAPSGRASVLIFDHQPLLVRGLASLLRDEVGVTAFVSSGRPDLLAAEMADFSPDVVVLGVTSDMAAALEVAQTALQADETARLIVLLDPQTNFEAADLIRLGISSVISRDASLDEVVLAVRQVLAGQKSLDGEMASRLIAELTVAVRRADHGKRDGGLTKRELQVLTLVADGLPNRDVANRLHISENTVKNHMRSVHEKLGVRTRTEAVVKAAREGLLGIG
ncbi:MAG: response regulator transcription factor [Candidatus Nanopelagicales bacterium]